MPETPEAQARIAKLQKDVEELKENMRDSWHDRLDAYKERVAKVIERSRSSAMLWLEIDGIRSLIEIEEALKNEGREIPHVTLWVCSQRLLKAGLIKKVDMKGKSPVYAKKPWAIELGLDDYVREMFVEENWKT